MIVQALVFYMFATVAVVSATLVVTARNPVHSILWLILTFFNAAGLFVLLDAEFIAVMLVAIHAGAVAVLFVFAAMMLDIDFAAPRRGYVDHIAIGLPVAGVLFLELAVIGGGWALSDEMTDAPAGPVPDMAGIGNIAALGRIVYTDYVYTFQASALVLLVAMIGAIVLTHRQHTGTRRQNGAGQTVRDGRVKIREAETGQGG